MIINDNFGHLSCPKCNSIIVKLDTKYVLTPKGENVFEIDSKFKTIICASCGTVIMTEDQGKKITLNERSGGNF